jgi:dihydroorotase
MTARAGNRGLGRPKGAKNKANRAIKNAFVEAFEKAGGVDGLVQWAIENRTDFYKLVSKLIPVEVEANVEHVIEAVGLTDDELAAIAAGSGDRTSKAKGGPAKPDSVH